MAIVQEQVLALGDPLSNAPKWLISPMWPIALVWPTTHLCDHCSHVIHCSRMTHCSYWTHCSCITHCDSMLPKLKTRKFVICIAQFIIWQVKILTNLTYVISGQYIKQITLSLYVAQGLTLQMKFYLRWCIYIIRSVGS